MLNKKGKIILSSIYKYQQYIKNDETSIRINAALKAFNKGDLFLLHKPELAPSNELFHWYLNNKIKDPNWFITYKKRYKKEIQSNEKALATMREIGKLTRRGKDVILCCYCSDYNKCHRSILGEAFIHAGYEVEYH